MNRRVTFSNFYSGGELGNQKWLDSLYILRVELALFSGKWMVGCKRNEEGKDDSKVQQIVMIHRISFSSSTS